MRWKAFVCALLAAAACGGPDHQEAPDAGQPDAGAPDAGQPDAGQPDAGQPDAGLPDAGLPEGVAPAGTIPGELRAEAENAVSLGIGGSAVYRFESEPTEHVGLRLTYDAAVKGVTLQVKRWDGAAPADIGITDAGAGIRVLAARDGSGTRTFWARIDSKTAALPAAKLTVVRTPFTDGIKCDADCALLLQLPLPNDPKKDGYSTVTAIFRYQFGRRDLVMFLRDAARRLAAGGLQPFSVADLSQWDGLTPGTDVGAPRHVSHQRGKDVDLALYGDDGRAVFRSFCTTQSTSDGRICLTGTRQGLDAYSTARLIGNLYDSGRVTMDFLDQELINAVKPAASAAANDGLVTAASLPLFSDGKHLQHWPNHDNHVHVRVSESTGTTLVDEPFEAP